MQKPKELLDHYYLDARCMLLELGATLDRYDRACEQNGDSPASTTDDPRVALLREAIDLLATPCDQADRAERLLNIFSDPKE